MNNTPFIVLLCIIAFDYLTGIAKAWLWKVSDSSVGFKGLVKHTLVIVMFVLIWFFCNAIGVPYIAYILEVLYGLNYLLSILENFAVMGIYQPKFLKVKIQSEIAKYEKQLEEGLSNKDLLDNASKQKIEIKFEPESILNMFKESENGEKKDDKTE